MLRLAHGHCAHLVESARECRREQRRHVLHDEHGGRHVLRQTRHYLHQRARPARRCRESDRTAGRTHVVRHSALAPLQHETTPRQIEQVRHRCGAQRLVQSRAERRGLLRLPI
jgi:hypothetical protein